MKKINKKHLLMLAIPFVIASSIFSVVNIANKNSNNIVHEFVVDLTEKNYRKVYLLDDNKYLIPLSVDVSAKKYLVDEIYTIVSNLRDLEVEGFNTILAKDVKINKIELENGILNIDFSKEFLAYQSDLEEKIIESLTWSVMDFEQVKGLTISVDGVKLEKMPINGLQLPSVLNKEIGINKYSDLTSNLENGDTVVVLYEKLVQGTTYYVPVTRRIEYQPNDVLQVVKSLDKQISLLSGLTVINKIKAVDVKNVTYDDIVVNVNLGECHLIEDNLIDDDIYKILMVAFEYNDIDAKVNFYVNDESVEVNGYSSNQQEVSNIVFNEIEI